MEKIKTIGLVAPSGALRDTDEINKKISILEEHFKIKKFYSENKPSNALSYLSDTDENRIRYFEEAFLDKEIDLVLSIRGGYGAIRIADKINYDLIKNSAKRYIASSDATILLCALYKKTNIKCYHSLMITNGFVENFKKNIEIIENDSFNLSPKPITNKKARGVLWGGNLSTLVSMFSGEQFLPEEDIILFLEDLNEPLYKIDKMLYEIYRNEKLRKKIKGIIFGDFYLEDEEIMPLLRQYAKLFDVACFVDKNITHKQNNITLPFGKYINL